MDDLNKRNPRLKSGNIKRGRKRANAEGNEEGDHPRPLRRCRICDGYVTAEHVKQVCDTSGGAPWWAVECPSCDSRGPVVASKGLAIKYWNEGISHEWPRRLMPHEKAIRNGQHLPRA
jgi:hypothetical protein